MVEPQVAHASEHDPREGTSQRLLDVATQVFAEYGYQGATVRLICQLAQANVAAVNYHFKGKDGLYLAVVERLLEKFVRDHPVDAGLQPDEPPRVRLRKFVRAFLGRVLQTCPGSEMGQIMAHEMNQPSAVMDLVLERMVRPMTVVLGKIIQDLAGGQLSPFQVQRCIASVIGQCLHYKHSCPIIQRINPALVPEEGQFDELAAHIAEFSAAGIVGIARSSRKDGQGHDEMSPHSTRIRGMKHSKPRTRS